MTLLSPVKKGEPLDNYLTQFSCKLAPADTNFQKIAAFKPSGKIAQGVHFITSNFHKHELSVTQYVSRNLINLGGIIQTSIVANPVEFLTFTAVKSGTTGLTLDFTSLKGLTCDINTVVLDGITAETKKVVC